MDSQERNGLRQMLRDGVIAVNLGLREFAESLEVQDVKVVHIEWFPPAGGDQEMIDLLDKLL